MTALWPDLPFAGETAERSTPVIALEEVRKTYTNGTLSVEALRGISLTINEGDYVAIMGPSGSGKSTLMHILGCLDVPSDGRYLLAGEDVSRMSEDQLAAIRNRRIGFVFQQFNLLRVPERLAQCRTSALLRRHLASGT